MRTGGHFGRDDDSLEMNNTRKCPENFEDWTSRFESESSDHITSEFCYKIFRNKLNWTEAELRCEEFGGNLLSIPSSLLNDVITRNMENKELGHLWIGLTKSGRQR